jgi:hypothetical protein
MRFLRLPSSLALLVATALVASAAPAAASVPGATLGLTGFSHMLVEGAHGHVFVTGSASDSVIEVENENGTSAGTITGESGAGGMVLDGTNLYVARCGWGVIDEIDTATLTVTGSFAADVGGTCDLAEANGRLWYSNSSDHQFGDLISVSLDSSHTPVDSGLLKYQMTFATTSVHPGWLVVGEADQSPSDLSLYDVSNPASPTRIAGSSDLGAGGAVQQLSIAPDGSTLLTASGAFSLPDLTPAGLYPTPAYPDAMAVSPSGSMVAGGADAAYAPDVFLFDTGDAAARASWDFGSSSDTLYPGGIAFSADNSTLFAVSRSSSGSSVVFHALSTNVPAATPVVNGFDRMLVDPAHGHIFVSGSQSSSAILVENADGTTAGTISGESGAAGMVLDGTTLYVARCSWGVIDEIDTTTLTRTGSFAADIGGTCDLAEAGGRLWYSNSHDGQWGELMSVSPAAPHTVVDSGISEYQMIFATTSTHPNWLVVGDSDLSASIVAVQDVSDPASPTRLAGASDLGGGGNLQDMAITADGSKLVTAAGAPYRIQAFALPGLTAAGTYPTDAYPDAVALSPSGAQIAGGSDSASGKDVFLFGSGNATPLTSWGFGTSSDTVYQRGLAFSSDGSKLFAVSKSSSGSGRVFHVLPTVVLPKGSVSIHASTTTITYGHSLTLTAHLSTASANHVLSIYRRPATGGTPVLVRTATAGAAGNISVTVGPSANTVYTAVWTGDTAHAATASAGVEVRVHVVMHLSTRGGYATSSGNRLYHYTTSCSGAAHTGCPQFLSYAAPAHPNHTFAFTLQVLTSSGWKTALTHSYSSGSNGQLLVTLYYSSRGVIGVRQRVHVSMAADSDHLGAVSPWVYFRVTA